MKLRVIHAGSNFPIHIFGKILILSFYMHLELLTKAQFVTFPRKRCYRLMFRQTAPEWLKRWEMMFIMVMTLRLNAFRAMSKMVKFGLASRQWLTMWEHMAEVEAQRREVMRPVTLANPATCTHPVCRRYGNIHGSFSRCKRCGQRFKWDQDQEGWQLHGEAPSQASSHLPPPSSSTILANPGTSTGRTSRASRTTTSKARAKPKAKAVPVAYMPALDPAEDWPETWDPEAFPPESDGGEDGFQPFDIAMDIQDFT